MYPLLMYLDLSYITLSLILSLRFAINVLQSYLHMMIMLSMLLRAGKDPAPVPTLTLTFINNPNGTKLSYPPHSLQIYHVLHVGGLIMQILSLIVRIVNKLSTVQIM